MNIIRNLSIIIFIAVLHASASAFTYKGNEYTYSNPNADLVKNVSKWSPDDGEVPVSPAEAYKLAKKWIKDNLGEDFEDILCSITLSIQTNIPDRKSTAYWMVHFMETKESLKQLDEKAKQARKKPDQEKNNSTENVISLVPANIYIFVLLDKTVIGPQIKE
ncbi:hypothetical protein Ga0100231_004750 [Opitutaceae bacterium TAV4]|nr:hypothetical protein Ga0100231_004750 [Opitutaceae bacterium TAV4]RRK02312.1 hypothetical protein Ga0100230_003900 [Opitutaceae bacterium TAV3]